MKLNSALCGCSKMGEAGDVLDQIHLSCSVCLDLLKHPVTINCGHSYCMECIEGCWDQEDHGGVYSCPQCRQTFTPRPVLGRNTILVEVVEKLKKAELQATPPEHCYAGPGDVVCDVCTGKKKKAVKSCLVCLASYCETHLQPHFESQTFKKHKLTEATGELQEKICSHHDKLLEIYCCTDQQCICYLCMMDEHRGHDTVSAAAGRAEKQTQLRATQSEFQQMIQQREKEMQELREAVDSLTRSAQAAVDHTDRIFTEMIRSIEERRTEMKEVIRAQENMAVIQVVGHLEQLEQEVAELKRRDSELEKLSHSEDHIHFLQTFQPLCVPPGPLDPPSITATLPDDYFGNVRKVVSDLKVQLEKTNKKIFRRIIKTVKDVHIVETAQPDPLKKILQTSDLRSREEFLHYAYRLTMNPNTANERLCLSKRNTVVTWEEDLQPHPDHPDRFDYWYQVLCTEGLTGRCYWEFQWDGYRVDIAVAYKGISRKGWDLVCGFGRSNTSWCLICSPSSYCFYHNDKETQVSGPSSSTIGVYLDHSAGTLSFYSISDTMNLLHRVHTSFTEPLYPGFGLWSDSSEAKLIFLK